MWTSCLLCAHPSGDGGSLAFDPASLGEAHLAVTWRAACSPLEAENPVAVCVAAACVAAASVAAASVAAACLRGQELQPRVLLLSSPLEPLLRCSPPRGLSSQQVVTRPGPGSARWTGEEGMSGLHSSLRGNGTCPGPGTPCPPSWGQRGWRCRGACGSPCWECLFAPCLPLGLSSAVSALLQGPSAVPITGLPSTAAPVVCMAFLPVRPLPPQAPPLSPLLCAPPLSQPQPAPSRCPQPKRVTHSSITPPLSVGSVASGRKEVGEPLSIL